MSNIDNQLCPREECGCTGNHSCGAESLADDKLCTLNDFLVCPYFP